MHMFDMAAEMIGPEEGKQAKKKKETDKKSMRILDIMDRQEGNKK